MVWLLAAIAVVALAIRFRWARYSLLVLLGLAIIGVVIGLVYHWHDRREFEASKHLIPLSDVQLDDMQLKPDYGSYKLTGRIHNNSQKYTVVDANIRVTMRDCLNEKCEIVGESDESVWGDIPPSQTRGIDKSVYFSSLPSPKGNFQWDYKVAYVRAEERSR